MHDWASCATVGEWTSFAGDISSADPSIDTDDYCAKPKHDMYSMMYLVLRYTRRDLYRQLNPFDNREDLVKIQRLREKAWDELKGDPFISKSVELINAEKIDEFKRHLQSVLGMFLLS